MTAKHLFGRAAPTISVVDMKRALDFYRGVLGFEKTFENGDPIGFAILKSGDAELHLSRNKHHRPSTNNVAHLMVEDASALYEDLEQRGAQYGARIIKGLRDAEYGLRGFVLADPDGNRIDIGQRLPAP